MSIYLTPANSYYLKKKISIDRGNAFECHSTRKTGGVSECQCNGELEKKHLHKIKTTLRLTCTRTRRVTSKKVNRIYKKIAYLSVTFSLIKLHFFTVLLEVTFSLVFLDFYVVFPHEQFSVLLTRFKDFIFGFYVFMLWRWCPQIFSSKIVVWKIVCCCEIKISNNHKTSLKL